MLNYWRIVYGGSRYTGNRRKTMRDLLKSRLVRQAGLDDTMIS